METSTSSFSFADDSQVNVELTLDINRGLIVRFILTGSATTTSSDVLIHWGITLNNQPNIWFAPSPSITALKHLQWNDSIIKLVPGAAQTQLEKGKSPDRKEVEFVFMDVTATTPLSELPRTIEFVLHFPPSRWVKNGKSNFVVPLSSFLQSVFGESQLQDAASLLVKKRLDNAPQHLNQL